MNISQRDRLIGLQACAKAIHRDGQAPEETARQAIVLYDLLVANAENPTVLPRERLSRYRVLLTEEQRKKIEELIKDNKLDRARFEQWLAGYIPSVEGHGIAGLSVEEAERILGRPEACLKVFRDSVSRSQEEKTEGEGQTNKNRAIRSSERRVQ